jgi:hypothetical protein
MTIEDQFHSLSVGDFTYYAIQSRLTHKSGHNKPDGPLIPVAEIVDEDGTPYKPPGWGGVSEWIAEPWAGTGNNWKPQYRESYEETRAVQSATGRFGWWSLKYAVQGFYRMQDASAAGQMNYKHEGKDIEAVRYEFRIVKVHVTKQVDLVSVADLMDALSVKDKPVEAAKEAAC